jgi:hypothetical protein
MGGQRGQQIGNLRIDRGWVVGRAADLLAEKLAVACPEPMSGDPHGSIAHPQLSTDAGVRRGEVVALQNWTKASEQHLMSRARRLIFEPLQHAAEYCQRPLALKQTLSGQVVVRLAIVAALGLEPVDGNDRDSSTTFGGPIVVAAIGQVVLAGRAQEGAEPAFRLVHACHIASLNQVGEESLDEILGLVGRESITTDKGI